MELYANEKLLSIRMRSEEPGSFPWEAADSIEGTILLRMVPFWKTGDGQYRWGLIVFLLFLLLTGLYDLFLQEGRGSMAALESLLLAVSAIALAPLSDQPRVRPWIWSVMHSPRYLAGACALLAAVGLFVYRRATLFN